MKRFHIHLSVPVLGQAIDFYSRLFAADPVVKKPNYARWMLDDPRLNFAVSTSTREENTGVDHLGIQVESEHELQELETRMRNTGTTVEDEKTPNAATPLATSTISLTLRDYRGRHFIQRERAHNGSQFVCEPKSVKLNGREE